MSTMTLDGISGITVRLGRISAKLHPLATLTLPGWDNPDHRMASIETGVWFRSESRAAIGMRAMGLIALGRRNWTFARSDVGGERAALFYSLIEKAKLHCPDSEAYLRHMLERIADYLVSRAGDLLTWNTTGIHPWLHQRIGANQLPRSWSCAYPQALYTLDRATDRLKL